MKIDFIYFDVGGVLALDFSKTSKWTEMLDDLGVRKEDRDRLNESFDLVEPTYCLGKDDADSFIKILKNDFGVQVPNNYSFMEDFVNRFEPNTELAEIVKSLKMKYRLGLLTNMYPRMLDLIIEKKLIPELEWDVVIDSSKVSLKKPQRGVYTLATDMSGVSTENILFIENSINNVSAAENIGWNTVFYDPSDVSGSNAKLIEALGSNINL